MIAKTRTDFCQIVTINGTPERDINNMQWNKLVINRPVSYYKLSYSDTQRPDLISMKVYGSMQYFWPLMKFNQIDDIWNDISIGDMIICPSGLDIEQYFATTKTYG
jgi:hypothetical protein